MKEKCPNIESCFLLQKNDAITENQQQHYLHLYCFTENKNYTLCKRYQTSIQYYFCPDFVLPDSPLKPDEIIDKYDEENN